MSSLDGNYTVVFNGEIYNYVELRNELKNCGYCFRTNSDTEVILVAYEHWGESCVQHFNGVWSFALMDSIRQQLFCSRDRLGEKPFFYAMRDGTFVFGSEIKALFAFGLPRAMNDMVLDAYLCFTYVPAPDTFFENIFKLPAGHNLIVRDGSLSIVQYWDVPIIPAAELRSDESAILEEFSSLFYDSVRLRMRSDVPFGAFLSGGLDSASVVAAMSEIHADPIQTFTAGFDEAEFDERSLAQAVATLFGTKHTTFSISSEQSQDLMQTLAHYYDEPFGDSSALPSYLVAGLARQHVTVVLTGDGGDEVLSGYTIHQGEKFSQSYQRIPSVVGKHVLPGLVRGIRSVSPSRFRNKLLRTEEVLRSSALDFHSRLLRKQNGFRHSERAQLITQPRIQVAEDYVLQTLKPVSHCDSLTQLNYWLTKVALPDDMLTKVDRASMAQSVEARLPFLDHRLVELMWSVSMDVRLKGYTRKHILRSTMGPKLPPELLSARKRGFVMPLREWMKGGQVDTLSRRIAKVSSKGLINRTAVAPIMSAHQRGDRDAANALWTLGMLSCSMEEHNIQHQEITT